MTGKDRNREGKGIYEIWKTRRLTEGQKEIEKKKGVWGRVGVGKRIMTHYVWKSHSETHYLVYLKSLKIKLRKRLSYEVLTMQSWGPEFDAPQSSHLKKKSDMNTLLQSNGGQAETGSSLKFADKSGKLNLWAHNLVRENTWSSLTFWPLHAYIHAYTQTCIHTHKCFKSLKREDNLSFLVCQMGNNKSTNTYFLVHRIKQVMCNAYWSV